MIEDLAACIHTRGAVFFTEVADAFAVRVTRSAAGVTHDHGEIALLNTLERYREEVRRLVRLVGSIVFGRLVVGAYVNAEHAEVGRVAGPNPVIGFAAEFADVLRGSSNETNVFVHDIIHGEVAVAVVKRNQLHTVFHAIGFFAFGQRFGYFLNRFHHRFGALCFRSVDGDAVEHLIGYIFHFGQQGDMEIGCALRIAVFCPETVFKDVIVRRAQFLNGTKTTMVVGEEETLVADDFTAAEHAALFGCEAHNGVFQTAFVDAVNVFSSELETFGLHGILKLGHHRQRPHAFVGTGRQHQ